MWNRRRKTSGWFIVSVILFFAVVFLGITMVQCSSQYKTLTTDQAITIVDQKVVIAQKQGQIEGYFGTRIALGLDKEQNPESELHGG